MRKLFIPIALLLLLATGCHRTPNESNQVDTQPYTLIDSVYYEDEYEQGYNFYTVNIDVPITDNDSLRHYILKWMLSADTDDYETALNEEKDRFLEEEGSESRAAFESNYTLTEQTDRYVTYISEGYLYAGGAHPMPWYYGVTFSKTDGNMVGYDLFEDPESLVDLISENIKKQYFDPYQTEEEAYAFDPETPFPLPENDPWIETDSIVFCYGPFEIAPYAAGLPLCKIAISDLKPYFSAKGNALLNN